MINEVCRGPGQWCGAEGGTGWVAKLTQQSSRLPEDWIEKMKKSNQLIMGIGHRIKSLANPDQRAMPLASFGLALCMPSTPILASPSS